LRNADSCKADYRNEGEKFGVHDGKPRELVGL
jgi:hypothetical protein